MYSCGSSFYIKKTFQQKKIHSDLFLSLPITGFDVIDIIRYPSSSLKYHLISILWRGRVVRWCWVNFQCRCVLLIWIIVGQGPTPLAVGGGCLDIFSVVYHFSLLSPSLWETARYRLKYCLRGPLSPKQPANQHNKYSHCLLAKNIINIKT